jgi:hypothetical protein
MGCFKNDGLVEGIELLTTNDFYFGSLSNKNNKREGQGCYFWKEGEFYDGKWKNGKRDGNGVKYYADESEK